MERELAEAKDRVARLTKQCGELQAENRELKRALDKIFCIAREVA